MQVNDDSAVDDIINMLKFFSDFLIIIMVLITHQTTKVIIISVKFLAIKLSFVKLLISTCNYVSMNDLQRRLASLFI